MKRLIKLIVLVIYFLVYFSCSSDEGSTSSNPLKLTTVTELITQNGELTDFGPESSVTYQYGTNNFVNTLTASGGFSREFNYNSNNQIISEVYTNDNGVSYSTNYIYENNLIKREIYEDGHYVEFVYEGNLATKFIYIYPNNPQNNISITLHYDSNENVVSIIIDETSEVMENYIYDDKINPFSQLFPSEYNKIKRISNNNMTYREDCDRTITYTYNEENLPISSTYNDCGNFTKERNYYYQ